MAKKQKSYEYSVEISYIDEDGHSKKTERLFFDSLGSVRYTLKLLAGASFQSFDFRNVRIRVRKRGHGLLADYRMVNEPSESLDFFDDLIFRRRHILPEGVYLHRRLEYKLKPTW